MHLCCEHRVEQGESRLPLFLNFLNFGYNRRLLFFYWSSGITYNAHYILYSGVIWIWRYVDYMYVCVGWCHVGMVAVVVKKEKSPIVPAPDPDHNSRRFVSFHLFSIPISHHDFSWRRVGVAASCDAAGQGLHFQLCVVWFDSLQIQFNFPLGRVGCCVGSFAHSFSPFLCFALQLSVYITYIYWYILWYIM